MNKIPEDIMVRAEAAYDALGRGSDADAQVIARAILAERKRCAEAVIHSCMYGHYASEGTCLAALDKIDAVSAQMHKGNVERFREFMESSPPPTVFRLEAAA